MTIAAHVQYSKVHMCRMQAAHAGWYLARMKPEQQVIASWIERVRAAKGWSFDKWAEEAGFAHPSTISRAVKPDFASVTKIETLQKLAESAGLPTVLDFLEGQARPSVPSEHVLAAMIEEAQREIPTTASYGDWPRVVASSLRAQLLQFQSSGGTRLAEDRKQEIAPEAGAPPPAATTRSAKAGPRKP